jgi:hypothetical protein
MGLNRFLRSFRKRKDFKQRNTKRNMALFGKGDEYVDYTLLKKKGLLKIKEEERQKKFKAEGGFIDFTSFRNEDNSPQQTAPTGGSPVPNFGFLSDMASAGAANTPSSVNPLANLDTFAPSTSASGLSGSVDAKELNAMKIKMDDIEYKLDRFIERIDKLEEKLGRINIG